MRAILRLAFSIAFLFLFASAYAQQDIERATRETDRLTSEEIGRKIIPPVKKPEKIKPIEVPLAEGETKFFVKLIKLYGNETFLEQEFSSIVSKYENKEATLSQLKILCKEIEREYLRKGVIAAVFVPPQELNQGIVVLRIVEAKMGNLQVADHNYFKKERINYYWRIPPGEALQYDELSKSIQLMNKNPDREVKATLAAGSKPETTDVILTPQTIFPVHPTFSYDTEGQPSTGKTRIGVGARHNNFLGLDDTLMGGYTFGRNFSGEYVYHSLPVSPNGLALIYGYSQSKDAPGKDLASSLIRSKANSVSASLNQDLYNKDQYLGSAFFGFDAKDKAVSTKIGLFSKDKLRIFSAGVNLLKRDFGSSTNFSPAVYQGVDALGATSKGNPYASRGAKSQFTKLKIDFQHKRSLPLGLQANLRFKSQLASEKLTSQEEYSLGGIDSVRGYPPDDYLADNAVNSSAELLIPAFFIPQSWQIPTDVNTLRQSTTFLVFADQGWGMRVGHSSTDKKSVNDVSAGLGVRFSFLDQALIRLEWGFPYGGGHPITEGGHSRFHVSIDIQGKVAEQLDKITKAIQENTGEKLAWRMLDAEMSLPDSPIRKKISDYLDQAKADFEKGNFEESKEYYQKAIDLGDSLYAQAKEYIENSFAQKKMLVDENTLALTYYKAGNFAKAKEIWQKVINEAKQVPLTFKF